MKKLSFVLAAAGLMTLAACKPAETPTTNTADNTADVLDNTSDLSANVADNATDGNAM